MDFEKKNEQGMIKLKSQEDSFDFKENQILKVLPLFLTTYSSRHTRIVYQTAIEEFVEFCFQNRIYLYQLKELQRFHLNAWQRRLEASSLSPSSISTKLSAMISFCRFLAENEWIDKNPGQFIKLPKISKQRGKTEALSEDEIKFILDHLKQEFIQAVNPSYNSEHMRAWLYYGIFLTISTVGMRCSEFINLKISDFEQSGSYYRLHLNLKGGEQHSPLIPNYLSGFLKSYIQNCRSFAKTSDPLFIMKINSNDFLKREVVSSIISKVAKKYNIKKKISAHSLRATVASLLHKNNIPIGEIKELLGHKSIMTTMMYVRKTDEEKESAALKNPLGNILNLTN